jgi:hypothetical protein
MVPSEPVPASETFADLPSDSGLTIATLAERAITVAQLRQLLAHAARRCEAEAWRDLDGRLVTAQSFTMHDVIRHAVKPATQARGCSFVERVATCAQPTMWCVSFWWAPPTAHTEHACSTASVHEPHGGVCIVCGSGGDSRSSKHVTGARTCARLVAAALLTSRVRPSF